MMVNSGEGLYVSLSLYIYMYVCMLVPKDRDTGEKGYSAAQQARLLTTCPSSLLSSWRIFSPL